MYQHGERRELVCRPTTATTPTTAMFFLDILPSLLLAKRFFNNICHACCVCVCAVCAVCLWLCSSMVCNKSKFNKINIHNTYSNMHTGVQKQFAHFLSCSKNNTKICLYIFLVGLWHWFLWLVCTLVVSLLVYSFCFSFR